LGAADGNRKGNLVSPLQRVRVKMTHRLYYDEPYRRDFDARVVRRLEVEGRPAVVLDRTAFYPTGGGQPCDLGELNGVPVLEVRSADGEVVHLLAGELAADEVRGRIDWARRFDHMQQHTGQHILSQACIRTLGAETVSFHLGAEVCTIDLDREVDAEGLAAAELLANRVIGENRPLRCRFVDVEELARLPLRRPPRVEGPVRVVEIAGFDWSACSGTHLRTTAEVGLIKVCGAERHRGGTTRVSFLCGGRALADYDRKQKLVRALVSHFTTGEEELLEAVRRLSQEAKQARRALRRVREALVAAEAGRLYAEAEAVGGMRIVKGLYSGDDWDAASVRALATRLAQKPGCVALLGWVGEKSQLTFARAADISADMGALMRMACERIGGRGGGRPDWAQGGGPGDASLAEALAAAVQALLEKIE